MVKVVLGVGTSHSPVLSTPPESMPAYAEGDRRNSQLLRPPAGNLVTYDELLAQAEPAVVEEGSNPNYEGQWQRYLHAIGTLEETLAAAKPDVAVIFGDDQEELFYDDNVPSLSVYWGDTIPWAPRPGQGRGGAYAWGYGEVERDYPVDSTLAKYVIEFLMDKDFDVAQSRYLNEEYGGHVGPVGYINSTWTRPMRCQGMGHAYGFFIRSIMKSPSCRSR